MLITLPGYALMVLTPILQTLAAGVTGKLLGGARTGLHS